MAIQNIKEANKVLQAYGLKEGSNKVRRKQLGQKARWMLEAMAEGADDAVYRVRETLGKDVFDAVTLDAANNSLLDGYGSVPDDWQKISKAKSARDFKAINATALSGLANLSTVPENANYTYLDQVDQTVAYNVLKRGNLLSISMEASFNDEIGAFNDQTEKLGSAAKNTLNELVLGTLFDDNPTCDYDSVALFHANHNNLQESKALSHDNVQAAVALVMNQTGQKSERIYLRPTFLAVQPRDLLTATELVKSAQLDYGGTSTIAGTSNAIPQFISGVFSSPHLDKDTSNSDFYIFTNYPVVEVSFLRGQQQPEILREPENTGRSFTTDAITWKVRHVYGGDVVDHRGAVSSTA